MENSLLTNIKRGSHILRQFKNPLFEICLKDSNVLSVDLSNSHFDKEEVERVIENVKHIAQKKKYLILVNSGAEASITLDGLRALATNNSFSYALAKAYVVQTIPQRIMANFYLHYFKPQIPVKFFKTRKDAEVWLLKSFRHLFYQPQQTAVS